MVPAITAGGRSFKGAFLYYAHDKRRDGEAVRFTIDRVAWVETSSCQRESPLQQPPKTPLGNRYRRLRQRVLRSRPTEAVITNLSCDNRNFGKRD
jgi:hypothetical protein